jgi:hypothetical protein
MGFPETVAVCAKIIWLCKPTCYSAVQVLVSDDVAGEEAGCGGPGLAWLHVVCVCEAGWMFCQILKNDVEYGLW